MGHEASFGRADIRAFRGLVSNDDLVDRIRQTLRDFATQLLAADPAALQAKLKRSVLRWDLDRRAEPGSAMADKNRIRLWPQPANWYNPDGSGTRGVRQEHDAP